MSHDVTHFYNMIGQLINFLVINGWSAATNFALVTVNNDNVFANNVWTCSLISSKQNM